MNKPHRIAHEPPLISVGDRRARLVGFLRLTREPPGLVQPVFLSEGKQPLYLYQRTGATDVIRGFVSDPALRPEKLIGLDQVKGDEDVLAHIGGPAMHAYEIAKGEIRFGGHEEFRQILHEALQRERFLNAPFAALEIAQYVGDQRWEEKYASRCFSALAARSPNLAVSWISGAELSSRARQAANKVIAKEAYARLDRTTRSDSNRDDVELNTNKPDLSVLLSHVAVLRRRGDIAGALSMYRDILREFPEHMQTWIDFAHTLRKFGATEEGHDAYLEVIRRFPVESSRRLEISIGLRKMGYIDEALQELRRSASVKPESYRVWSELAVTLQKLGRTEEAIAQYRDIFSRYAGDLFASQRAAVALNDLMPDQDGIVFLYELTHRFPNVSIAFKSLAAALHKKGRTEEAMQLYEEILTKFPRDLSAIGKYAKLTNEKGNHERAIALYRELIEIAPRKRKHWEGLISALKAAGQKEEADRQEQLMSTTIGVKGPPLRANDIKE